jgi:hypothetical protein
MAHAGGQGYTVEFLIVGEVETRSAAQVRPVRPDEIAHVRQRTATTA